MKSVSRMLLSSLIVAIVTGSAFAGILPVEWIGDRTRATTHQCWSFQDVSNPAYPDSGCGEFYNPYESPYNRVQAMITSDPAATWRHIPEYDGRKGVLFADSLEVRFHVLNTENIAEDSYKDVVFQAIFQGNLEGLTVTAAANSIQPRSETNIYDLGDGWKKLEKVWRIRPNPSEEWICFGLEGTGGALDSVCIDTICVPEPATILLLGLGGVVAGLKRRNG